MWINVEQYRTLNIEGSRSRGPRCGHTLTVKCPLDKELRQFEYAVHCSRRGEHYNNLPVSPNSAKAGAGDPLCRRAAGDFGAQDLQKVQGTFKPQPDS